MKSAAFFLSVMCAILTVLGQGSALSQTGADPARAKVPPPAEAAVQPRTAPAAGDDLLRIPSAGAPAPESDDSRTTNLWKLVRSGGWAMIPLGVLSVLTVMLVLVYLFTLRRGAILTPHYMNTADVLLKKRDYLGLLAISSRHSEAVARVVQRTLDFATKNPNASYETVRDIAETEGSAQAASLQHRTTYLADIGMLSPMIGLLGTVFGMINSFGLLGSERANQAAQSRDVLLAGGVSEALVATASGLILGIIAMAFYSLFRNRVQSLISDLEIASAHVMGLIALNYNKKREQSRLAVEDEF
ncbi:MAG: MotA/TolQ/ExbB proton channel family protein [Chthoniobacteraceae bacterium]